MGVIDINHDDAKNSGNADGAKTENHVQQIESTESSSFGVVASSKCQDDINHIPPPQVDVTHNSHILVNNFQIKKVRFRVLWNHDQMVWERLESKRCRGNCTTTRKEKATNKAAEEHLSNGEIYSSSNKSIHVNEIVRVVKGTSKSATLRPVLPVTSGELTAHQKTTTTQSTIPIDQYLTIHYAEHVVNSSTDCNRWRIRSLTLYNSDPYVISHWHTVLTDVLSHSDRLKIRHLLVFINPYGGRRKALQTYERYCKPIFQIAGVDASCIISQRANQIRDILMQHDLSPFDAVCCVGGDGTIAEVINGLIFRTIRDQGMDMIRPKYIPKPCLPIGMIPAGSTDSIVYSLHGTNDVPTAAIHMILGRKRGLDVSSVRNKNGILRFCTSILSYGYLGDVAAESEQYRWMGTKRYEFVGAKTFLRNRGYDVELKVLEEDVDTEQSDNNALTICYEKCEQCQMAVSQKENEQCHASDSDNDDDELPTSSHSGRVVNLSTTQSCHSMESSSTAEMLDSPKQSIPTARWKTISGHYFMISSANITCVCRQAPIGVAPYCHLGDGHMDLILVRKSSLFNTLRFALMSMSRKGDIRTLPSVEVIRTRKFSFRTPNVDDYSVRGSCQPITDNSVSELNGMALSNWNCDGEVLTDCELITTTHCQLLDVFMRGPFAYKKPNHPNNTSLGRCIKSVFCCRCGGED